METLEAKAKRKECDHRNYLARKKYYHRYYLAKTPEARAQQRERDRQRYVYAPETLKAKERRRVLDHQRNRVVGAERQRAKNIGITMFWWGGTDEVR